MLHRSTCLLLKDPIHLSPQTTLRDCSLRAGKAVLCGAAAGLLVLAVAGCQKAAPPPPAPQAMPVQVQPVSLNNVPQGDTYVATIKSRRTTTLQPQVDGRITRILVQSGQNVKAGQLLLQIDPLKQQAAVQQGVATELQQKSNYQYIWPRSRLAARRAPTTQPLPPRKRSGNSLPITRCARRLQVSWATSPYIRAIMFRPPQC